MSREDAEEAGLHTGEHATAEARYLAAAAQLKGRDKEDREVLRELRQQIRAEKKVSAGPSRNKGEHTGHCFDPSEKIPPRPITY